MKKLVTWWALSIVTLLAASSSVAFAATANVSHSYPSQTSIQPYSLVSIDPNHTADVIASNTNNQKGLVGVALPTNDSLVAIDPSKSLVQVASTGTAVLLVSNVNGNINTGDQVSVSPFDGIGMKALPSTEIIGVAQRPFPDEAKNLSTETVTDINGEKHDILIGYIPVSIHIGVSLSVSGGNFLQRIGYSLTGKTLPTYRIVLSILVAVIAFFGLLTLIYASIYGSLVSIGRNPLAKDSIIKTLSMILGMVVATALIATLVIFLLLR